METYDNSELSDPSPDPIKTVNKKVYSLDYDFKELPDSPVVHEKTNVVISTTCRVDGSYSDPPWNFPEPVIFDWLKRVNIFQIEEEILSGINGSFWAYAQGTDGSVRSLLLRFDTIGLDRIYESLGEEYQLDIKNHDLIRREQASYEICKALGCEDIVAPVAAIQSNLVPLISDDVRDIVSQKYSFPSIEVEERFGIIALAQMVPLNASSFVEKWAVLGADDKSRFDNASNSIRHGIYRFFAIDFILSTANRTLADLLYNRATDSPVVYGFGASIPSPSSSADWYLGEKAKGWRRDIEVVLKPLPPSVPVSGSDVFTMWNGLGDKEKEEFLLTLKEMSKAISEEALILACKASLEFGVPLDNLAGVVSRIFFMASDAESLVMDKFHYMKKFLVPLRKGFGPSDPISKSVINSTNKVMSAVSGQPYDFAAMMTS